MKGLSIINFKQTSGHLATVASEESRMIPKSAGLVQRSSRNKMAITQFRSSACKNASQSPKLMRLRNLIPTKAKPQLYKSAVLPYLTYCHLVWHFCRTSDSRKLERLQERGLRAVYRNKHATYSQLLERAKLTTLLNRRLQDICILMYKVKHRLCPNSNCNIFSDHTSGYNLRQ